MKRLLTVVTAMMVTLCVAAQATAFGARPKRVVTEVTVIEATSDIDQIPTYGAAIVKPAMTVTTGAPARFVIDNSNGWWYKKVGQKWVDVRGGSFSSGTWRFECQVRIDGEAGKTHRLKVPADVRVNGVSWTVGDVYYVGSDYSYEWVTSPEFTIPEPEELSFVNWLSFNIGDNWVGNEISPFSVAANAEGGKKPYVFSKTAGPDWITVATDGTVSGKPTAEGSNEDLVVRVTDAVGAFREITITVAPTAADPAGRTGIAYIEASSDIEQLAVWGQPVKKPTMTVTTGLPVYFSIDNSNGWWSKREDNGWVEVRNGTFTPGIWRFMCQVRIDGEAGKTHRLIIPFTVKVNDISWEMGDIYYVGNTYSYGWVTSPEYEVKVDTGIRLNSLPSAPSPISFTPDGRHVGKGYRGIVIHQGKKALMK